MIHPPPHAFSRSPVEEVFCQCLIRGRDPLTLSVPSPYPGWPAVRKKLHDMIGTYGTPSRISGCMLRYTDVIPGDLRCRAAKLGDISCLLSERIITLIPGESGKELTVRTDMHGSTGSILSTYAETGNGGWRLVFTIRTELPVRFTSEEAVLTWFDDARSEIHALFDRIVPEEIVQELR